MSDSDASSDGTQAQPQTNGHHLPKVAADIKVKFPEELKAGSCSYPWIWEWTWNDPIIRSSPDTEFSGKVLDKDDAEVTRDADFKWFHMKEETKGLTVTYKLMTVLHLKEQLKDPGKYKIRMDLTLRNDNRTIKGDFKSEFTVKEDIEDSSIRPSDEEVQYVQDVAGDGQILHTEFEQWGYLSDFGL